MFRKLLPALAAPLLLLAACGSSGDALRVETGASLAALQQAPDAAAEAGSAHVEMTTTMSTPGGDPVELEGSGDYDLDNHRMAMQMDLGTAFAAMAPSAGNQMPAGFDEPIRLVMDGTTMYVQIPFLTAFAGTSGWLSVPLDGLRSSGLDGISGFGAGADPGAMLDYLRGAGEVTEQGHEEIDGVDTTRYAATLDLAKALDEVPEAQRAELQDKIAELDASTDLPVTVWIDSDGLPRQMRTSIDAPGAGTVTMTMTWSKYGEPVAIEVPDPADVTPAKDALGGLASSFLGQR